jgi:sugar lactone lactonase YvrE
MIAGFRLPVAECYRAAESSDPLLGPGISLTPPFGAKGIECSNDGKLMFVANTALHRIVRIPVYPNGKAGKASILITGINAPDGIAIDAEDNIWTRKVTGYTVSALPAKFRSLPAATSGYQKCGKR